MFEIVVKEMLRYLISIIYLCKQREEVADTDSKLVIVTSPIVGKSRENGRYCCHRTTEHTCTHAVKLWQHVEHERTQTKRTQRLHNKRLNISII